MPDKALLASTLEADLAAAIAAGKQVCAGRCLAVSVLGFPVLRAWLNKKLRRAPAQVQGRLPRAAQCASGIGRLVL